jgi:VCBS repeat-containing protein
LGPIPPPPEVITGTDPKYITFEINQDATFDRQAFEGTLAITNGSQTYDLEDLVVNIKVTDEEGNVEVATPDDPIADGLYFAPPKIDGALSGEFGGWVLAADSKGTAGWLIIPTKEAGGHTYELEAEVMWQWAGISEEILSRPVTIKVDPQPFVQLDYFIQPRFDAGEPFYLGVEATNTGEGTIENLQIATEQPRIVSSDVENPEVRIVSGFTVDGNGTLVASDSLTLNFVDLDPGQSTLGWWNLQAWPGGEVTDFTATAVHDSALGGEATSLLDVSASTHWVTKFGLVRGASGSGSGTCALLDWDCDGVVDSLYDTSDSSRYDLSVVLPDVSQTPTFDSPEMRLHVDKPAGWIMMEVADPFGGSLKIANIFAGNRVLDPDNYWVKDGALYIVDDPATDYVVLYETQPSEQTETGQLHLDKVQYSGYTSVATITLYDSDLDVTFGPSDDAVSVQVTSPADTNGETVVLTESAVPGVFTGTFGFEPGIVLGNGKIYAQYGQLVTVSYEDQANQAGEPVTVTAQAQWVSEKKAPIVAVDDAYSTDEDTILVVEPAAGVLWNDGGAPDGSLMAHLVDVPTHGTFFLGEDGSFTYTPSANWNGSDEFTYSVSDGVSESNTATVTLTVTPINDVPILAPIANQTVTENHLLSFTASASDVDDNTLTYSLTNAPDGSTFDQTTGVFAWTPTEAQGYGVYHITVGVSDGILSDSKDFTLTVMEDTHIDAGQFAGDTYADTFRLAQTNGTAQVFLTVNGLETLIFSALYGSFSSLTFTGSSDSDSLIIDYSGGNPIPAGGISYDGGLGSDSLTFQGGQVSDVTYTFTSKSSGTVNIDGSLITYSNLEPVSDSLTASTRSFIYDSTQGVMSLPTTLTLEDTTSTITSDTGELVNFTNPNPTGSLTVLTGDGNDVINILSHRSTDPSFSLLVDPGAGSNRINDTTTGYATVRIRATNGSDTLMLTDSLDHQSAFLSINSSTDTFSGVKNLELVTRGDADTVSLRGYLIPSVFVDAGEGNDRIDASGFRGGHLTVSGGPDDDIIIGSPGNDILSGDAGNDWISGNAGDDTLSGGEGSDRLFGETGNDWLSGGPGDDLLDGGSGSDTADYSTAGGPVDANLSRWRAVDLGGGTAIGFDMLKNIENLRGTTFADVLTGDMFDNIIAGGPGVDTIKGLGGNDTFIWAAGDGNDTVDGGTGLNTVMISATNNTAGITGDTLTIQKGATDSFSGEQLSVQNIQSFFLAMGAGNDSVIVKNLTGSSVKTVTADMGPGNDNVDGRETSSDGQETSSVPVVVYRGAGVNGQEDQGIIQLTQNVQTVNQPLTIPLQNQSAWLSVFLKGPQQANPNDAILVVV